MDALDLLYTSPSSTSSIPENQVDLALVEVFHLVRICSSARQKVEVLVVLVVEDNTGDIVVILVEDVDGAGEPEVFHHPFADGH